MRPSLRFQILERDGFRCRYCGRSADEGAVLHVDHIHPRAHGGSEDADNLLTACSECNVGKSARLLGVTEQPVIFRGKTRENARKRRRRYPAAVPEVPKVWEVGSYCSTPLLVAAIGYQFGYVDYRETWKYLVSLGVGEMPPHRPKDAAWLRYLYVDTDYALAVTRGLVDDLPLRPKTEAA